MGRRQFGEGDNHEKTNLIVSCNSLNRLCIR